MAHSRKQLNMKIAILTLILFVAFSAKSQTIDTTFKPMTACKVVPFKAKFSDTDSARYLGVKIVNDDLKSYCSLYWCVMNTAGAISVEGNTTITGTNYTNWNGNNLYPFQFVGTLYNLTFK